MKFRPIGTNDLEKSPRPAGRPQYHLPELPQRNKLRIPRGKPRTIFRTYGVNIPQGWPQYHLLELRGKQSSKEWRGDVVSLLVFDTFPAQCQLKSYPFRYIDLHLGLLFLKPCQLQRLYNPFHKLNNMLLTPWLCR